MRDELRGHVTALHQSQVTCGEAGQYPHPQQRGPGGDAQGGHVLLLHLLVTTDPDGAEGHLPLQPGHYAAVESPGPV